MCFTPHMAIALVKKQTFLSFREVAALFMSVYMGEWKHLEQRTWLNQHRIQQTAVATSESTCSHPSFRWNETCETSSKPLNWQQLSTSPHQESPMLLLLLISPFKPWLALRVAFIQEADRWEITTVKWKALLQENNCTEKDFLQAFSLPVMILSKFFLWDD